MTEKAVSLWHPRGFQLWFFLLALAGCGGGSRPIATSPASPSQPGDPAPTAGVTITSITPSSIYAEGAAFPLSVAGSGFAVTPSIIYFGTNALFTTLVSDSLLIATVPASMIAAPGSVQITVGSPDWSSSHWSSNVLTLQILPPTPSVVPSADTLGPAGTRQFSVIGFGDNSAVSWSVAEGPAGGTITASGFYGAPVEKGTFHVIAASMSDPAESATATVTVVSSGFTPAGTMHVPRSGHTATLLNDGRVLISGGVDANGAGVDVTELFDPANGTFSLTGSPVTGRIYASATLLPDGRVLIAGGLGLTAPAPGNALPTLQTAEIFDPASGTFSPSGNLIEGRWDHTATLLNSGKVLIAGGYGNSCTTASTELFDPTTGTFSSAGFMLTERVFHTATLLNSGEVLMAGGSNGCVPDSYDDPPWDPLFVESFEPNSRSFQAGGNMSTTRIGHAAIRLANGQVLLLGGIPVVQNLHEQPPNPSYAELYDPVARTISSVPGLTIGHESYTATLLSSGMVLITGGADSAGNVTSDVQLLNATTNTLTATGGLSTPRVGHTATLLNDGRVLVTGGTDAGGKALTSAELYQ